MKKVKFVTQTIGVLSVLVTFLLVSCESVTNSEQAVSQPEVASVENNFVQGPPAISGPRVYRWEGSLVLLIVDPNNGHGYFVGGDVVELCQTDFNYGWSPVQWQDVYPAADPGRLITKLNETEVDASLWDPAVYTCDEILAAEPVATGTANFIYNDNDLFGSLNSDNKNAWGVSSSGKLETSTGQTVNVNAHSRCRGGGLGDTTVKCTEKVTVVYH